MRDFIAGGKTVLLTTHYLEEADVLMGCIVVLNGGAHGGRGDARRYQAAGGGAAGALCNGAAAGDGTGAAGGAAAGCKARRPCYRSAGYGGRAGGALSIFGLALLSAALSGVPWPTWLAAFAPALVFVPIIGVVNIFHAEKERADAKLRLAQGEIERLATVAERERIARDLHDMLGHTVYHHA